MKPRKPLHNSLILGLILLLAFLQWPMVKGLYFRLSGAPAGPSAVAWRSDLDAALAEAGKTGKPVLVDFSAEWCPPCQVMKHDVWTDAQVGREVERQFVPLAVDIDHDQGLADRYGISGIPTILILDASGKVLHQAGFMTRQELLDFFAKSTGRSGPEDQHSSTERKVTEMNTNVAYRSISPKELHAIETGGMVIDLVDVRTAGEFAGLHAEGARSVPLNELTPESVVAGRHGSPDQPFYIICQSGGRSRTACERLSASGLHVVNVDGGTMAWQRAGLPVVRGGNGGSSGLPGGVRVTGVLLAVAALVLGITVHSGFLWAGGALWVTLLVVNGGCPLGSCSVAAQKPACGESETRS